MSDLISRQAAITVMANAMHSLPLSKPHSWRWLRALAESALSHLESVQPDKEVEYWHELCNSYELTIVKLSAVVAEQLGTQWIPCSERLPEESDGTVLVCFPNEFPYSNKEPYINAKHNQRVKTASYSQFNKTWYIGDFGGIGEVRPIAWMPLPKPYIER